MAQEVILMDNVADLGAEGDIVTVADGYARNYLLPRDLAAPVTEATRRRLAKLQEQRKEERKLQLEGARKTASKLADASCTITVKVGKDEKMYGSVGAAEIVAAMKAQKVNIDRHWIVLEHPIKELGVFDVKLAIHPDVATSVKVWVVEE